MNMAICHTQKKKHELMVNLYSRAVKKKSNCGDDRLHKAGGQAIQESTTDVEGPKPQQQDY
jgi:hypothetical protein